MITTLVKTCTATRDVSSTWVTSETRCTSWTPPTMTTEVTEPAVRARSTSWQSLDLHQEEAIMETAVTTRTGPGEVNLFWSQNPIRYGTHIPGSKECKPESVTRVEANSSIRFIWDICLPLKLLKSSTNNTIQKIACHCYTASYKVPRLYKYRRSGAGYTN